MLTTPLSEVQARHVAAFIEGELDGVDAMVVSPRAMLRMAWDRESVEMFMAALTAWRESGGGQVPEGVTDSLAEWLERAD